MITKQQFVTFMNYIKETRDKEDKFNEGLSLCFGENNVKDIFIFDDIGTYMVEMLCATMGVFYNEEDPYYGDIIQYYIFDLNFGTDTTWNSNEFEIGNEKFILDSPENLYDYIIAKQLADSKVEVTNEDCNKG